MPRRSERNERSAFVLLTYYLLIIYLTCGVCACFFRYMLCTRMVCAWYFYLLVPTCTQMLPNFSRDAPYGASEASGVRSYYSRIIYLVFVYYLLTNYLLLVMTYCLRTTYLLRSYYSLMLVCLLDISHSSHLWFEFFSGLYMQTRFPFIVSQVLE